MQITDTLTLDASGLKLTRDGFLVGDAKVSRAGNVQMYLGREIGLTGEDANRAFGVYRDPNVVFDENSMLSLAGRPVTRGHPLDGVTADNWRDLAIGQVGGVIRRDGEHVVAPMAIMDAAAAKEVLAGARALSAGYTCNLVEDAGTAPDGTPYQFRQAGELRFNHVAYLPDNNPRAGNTRIGDGAAQWGAAPLTLDEKEIRMSDNSLKTVVLGDKAVQVAAADVQTIEAFKADAAKVLADAKADHDKAIAKKDGEIIAKDKEIADLKAEILAVDDLDKLIADRAALITKAKAISDAIVVSGKSDAEIKRAAVAAKLGDAATDKTDAYIDAMFDILSDAKPADPVAAALADAKKPAMPADRDKLYSDRVKALSDAWKPSIIKKEAV